MANQDAQVIEDFLNNFQLLTRKQKAIWNYLKGMAKSFRHVFPSHGTIAKSVGCCRETVIEAIKKFVDFGWLGIIKRFWRSHTYFLHEKLIDFDLKNPKTFSRSKIQGKSTSNSTLISETHDSQIRNVESVQPIEAKKEGEFAHEELKHIGLGWRDIVMLSKFSIRIVRLAIEDYVTYRFYKHVRNIAAFLTSRCQHYCKQAVPAC